MAERRGKGLQIPLHGFKSRFHLVRQLNKVDWRSWLARFLDMEEATGSSPVSTTAEEPPRCGALHIFTPSFVQALHAGAHCRRGQRAVDDALRRLTAQIAVDELPILMRAAAGVVIVFDIIGVAIGNSATSNWHVGTRSPAFSTAGVSRSS